MDMNSYCVIKGFNIFKNQTVRMGIITDFYTMQPFARKAQMEKIQYMHYPMDTLF